MKLKKTILVIIVIVVISNVAALVVNVDCRYANRDGSFTFEEMNTKERDFDMCKRKFEQFKQYSSDTVLYRLCRKNILEFWNWGNYLFSSKFKLTYKPWAEIKVARGRMVDKSGFQDF